jgi:iron complex outermembrane receptor protein
VKSLLCLIVLCLFFVPTQAQTSTTISGSVTDASNSAVKGARVTLRRETVNLASTATDENGRFNFENVGAGEFRVMVTAAGFAQQTVAVQSGANQPIRLTVASLTETIVITAEIVDYQAETSTTGSKLDLSRFDNPQSISVIPRQLISDRQVIRLAETADNVAGVRPLPGYGGISSIGYIYRGFRPGFTNGALRNGFREFTFLSARDVQGIERVEFLKGPASMLYGSGEVGGVVNTITKKPQSDHHYDVGLSFGSFGLARPTFDFTGALNENKSLLYRLNFAYERGDGFRDFGKNRSVFVAPALTWKLSNKTTLTTEFEYQRYRHTFDSGLPSTDQNFLSQPVNRFYGEPFNKAVNNQNSLTLNLTHQFNDNWSLRSGLNAINSQSDTAYANFSGANATQVNRVSYLTDEFSENYGSQNELYGRFSTGAVKHQLVTGFELARYVYTYTFDFDFSGFPAISRNNPVYGAKQLNRANYDPFFGDRSRSNALGLYVLDQITLAPRVKLQLGLRGDLVNSRQWEVVAAEPINAQNDQAVTPRAGIVVNPTDSTSVYFSFARSFLPTFGSGRSRTGETFQPITGRLFEVGVKQSLLNNRLFATLALYQLKRQNVLTPDPDDPTRRFNIQTGEQESKGVELELTGQITNNWNTSINYTATDAFVSKDNRLRVGSKLLGVSKHSGGIYTNYEFARGAVRGFSLGGGLYGFSLVFAGLPNPLWRIPGYVRADVNFGYRRDHFRAQVAIKNINDKKYFLAQGASNLVPQAPRHVVASVGYTF